MRAFFPFGVKRKFSHKVAVIILLTFKFSSHRLSHLNCRTTLWDDQVGYSSYDRLVFLAVHFLLIGSVTAHQMHFQPWKISPTFVGNIVCFPSSFFFSPISCSLPFDPALAPSTLNLPESYTFLLIWEKSQLNCFDRKRNWDQQSSMTHLEPACNSQPIKMQEFCHYEDPSGVYHTRADIWNKPSYRVSLMYCLYIK